VKPAIDVQKLLIGAKDYHQFLDDAFSRLKKESPQFSYAAFARKAGMSSRSFPRDVALGQKSLTLSSAKAFSAALGLRGRLNTFFMLLVERDEPSLRGPKATVESINARLLEMRESLLNQDIRKNSQSARDIFKSIQWLKIYSASGKVGVGATLEEISQRTKISTDELQNYMNDLLQKQILSWDGKAKRYCPLHSYQIFEDLKGDDFFRHWYLQSLAEAKMKVDKDFASDKQLFFTSMFSVRSDKMTEFRKELRDILQRFSEDSEDAEGDSLAKMVVGFYN